MKLKKKKRKIQAYNFIKMGKNGSNEGIPTKE
jgi:hypothetical protein